MAYSIIKKYTGKDLTGLLQDLWQDLIERGIVKTILLPIEMEGGLIAPGLLTNPDRKGDSRTLSPYMPLNTARILQMMTKMMPPAERMAAVLRPCETRALVELVKLKQIALDNVLVISIDCPGTYNLTEYKAMIERGEEPLVLLLNQINRGEQDDRLRESCRACLYPVAPWADIRLGFLGLDQGQLLMEALTENGERIIRGIGIETGDLDLKKREIFLEELKEIRKAAEQRVREEPIQNLRGPDKLLSALSSCIGCRNCMTQCPICYCKECFFNSPTFELEADRYIGLAKSRGLARMPEDLLVFHTTRMAHMASSCVACGMCTEACPMDVPVFQLFKAVSANVQELLNYEPGMSFDDEIPISTFREEELEDVQEPKI